MNNSVSTSLECNDPIVLQELKKHRASAFRENKESLPSTASDRPISKEKEFRIKLTVEQEARLIRESANRQISAQVFLQQVIDEAFNRQIGKAYVTSATFMGGGNERVTTPSTGLKDGTHFK